MPFAFLEDGNSWWILSFLSTRYDRIFLYFYDVLHIQNGNPLQYSCLGKSHGQRSLVGYSPWGCKESDTTEWLSTSTHVSRINLPKSTQRDRVEREGKGIQDGGQHMHMCSWFMLMYGKNHHSMVKQLSSN